MGLFDILFGAKKQTNVEVIPDHVWMTTDAKFAGIAKEAEERSRSGPVAVLLVAHFPDFLARLEELTGQQTWRVPCRAVPASNLGTDLAASLRRDESDIIDIIVGERHPLRSVDDRLEAFAEELPCRCRLSHHVSLEDAVMKVFASGQIKEMLKQVGMKEDDAIESKMVSRRIKQAQQRLERALASVDTESAAAQGAESAAEWMEKNCPGPVPK